LARPVQLMLWSAVFGAIYAAVLTTFVGFWR